jgi:hypothetical protein
MAAVAEKLNDAKQRISLDLTRDLVAHLDDLRREWGLRSRGDVLARLLDDLFGSSEEENDDDVSLPSSGQHHHPADDNPDFDEQGALVLVGRGAMDTLQAEFEWEAPTDDPPRPAQGGGGIDLPGFVRRRSDVIKRSLRSPSQGSSGPVPLTPLPTLGGELVQQALEEAGNHWRALYGSPANDAVLEADAALVRERSVTVRGAPSWTRVGGDWSRLKEASRVSRSTGDQFTPPPTVARVPASDRLSP